MNKSAFRRPPMDCRSVPFWAWNGALTEEETRRQVRELAEKGMGGAFMHARPGLRIPYFGAEWFANCAAAIDEGKKFGFRPWLYDEDRWPSGSGSGHTAERNPDFRARTLALQVGSAGPIRSATIWAQHEFDKADLLARFRMKRNAAGEMSFHRVGANARGSDIVSFYSATLPASAWHHGYYFDIFHPGAVREFIRNSYEPYARRFQGEFGRRVPGIFTDEPCAPSFTPWSVRLAKEFRARRGYDLIPHLPHVHYTTAQSPRIRHDYWKTLHELFAESFARQVGKWCERHGLVFTGHFNQEQSLSSQTQSCGGVMELYKYMGIPGIDILTERIIEVATVKQAASVCNQFDKPALLSELYGVTGYNLSFEAQKWIADWQMALGVNFLCQHLAQYSMKGLAKRDYPPSFLHQSPWWKYYRKLADYQARLCWVLRQGRPVRDILLLHPLTSAWSGFDPSVGDAQEFCCRELNRLFNDLMGILLGLHRDFDLGDEMILAADGRVAGQELVVGKARYELVIVPSVTNLESRTLDLLEKFVKAGGKLLWMGAPPKLVDGVPSGRARALAMDDRVHRGWIHRKHLEEILDGVLPGRLSIVHADSGLEADQIVCQQRRNGRETVLFLANTDCDTGVSLKIRLPGAGRWRQWDAETGATSDLPSEAAGSGSQAQITLAPAGSAVLTLRPGRPLAAKARPAVRERARVVNPQGGWSFRRLAPNSLILDRCAFRVNDEPFSEVMLLPEAQSQWRSRFGLLSARSMERGMQTSRLMEDPANNKPVARLTTRYKLRVDVLPKTETHLVLEDREEFVISINGSLVASPAGGWFIDKAFEKVPIGRYLKRGGNVIELQTTLSTLRVVEDVYVIGDFGVDQKTFALVAEPERLAEGDWCAQGYPFYTDGIFYQTRVVMPRKKPAGRVFVELERFEGPVAAVWVNGRRAAVLGWRPYRADVTDFVKIGGNDLAIEVIGTPRNLFGPRHTFERYPGHPFWYYPPLMLETVEPRHQLTPAGLFGQVRIVGVQGNS